jgi:hypothetical protein
VSTDLLKDLHGDEVPGRELTIVLGTYFPFSRYESGEDVDYFKDGDQALRLTYHAGELADIGRGPALTDGDVAALRDEIQVKLLADGTAVFRQLAFAHVPVTGGWRYRARFQICPAPDEAPRPPVQMGDHPFVLEVVHRASPDPLIASERGRRLAQEINLLLAAFVPAIKALRLEVSEQNWSIPLPPDGWEPMTPKWTQRGYFYDGFQPLQSRFTRLPNRSLQLVEDAEFYGRIAVSERVLDLPSLIETLFDCFHRLEPADRERIIRWAYWLNHSSLVWSLSQSASYIAIIQAIEALVPDVPGGPACPTCGRLTGPGPTKQFVEFMDAYVPRQDGQSEAERRKIYRLRSGLTHGGKLLRRDYERSFGSLHPTEIQERDSSVLASRLARLAGINLLLSPP